MAILPTKQNWLAVEIEGGRKMSLDPAQLDILGDKIVLVADVIALIAAQGEAGDSSGADDNCKEDNGASNLTPTQLNILSAWLTVIGDGLALLAALGEAQADN